MGSRVTWTREEDKIFEDALVSIPEGTINRWFIISTLLGGKRPEEVQEHYWALVHDIEAIHSGAVELPEYYDDDYDYGGEGSSGNSTGNDISFGSSSGKAKREERKRGTPWTEEEHRLFLDGLVKYGKGDWRNISRMCVKTKNATQVASHAQKYFIRQQNAGTKDTKRKSIHDITMPS